MQGESGVIRTKVAGVEIRVLKTEAHSLTSTPTQYPVESGKTIVDHVTLNPNGVLFRCEMTNTDSGTEEARHVMMLFAQMRDKREPLELLTEHASYKNMVLIGMLPVHQAPYKGALLLDLRFQQIGIIGEINMVSSSGGRPSNVISQDGTQATACGYSYAGEVRPINGSPLLNKCLGTLGGYAS